MADITVPMHGQGHGINEKYVDIGGAAHAKVIASAISAIADGSGSTAAAGASQEVFAAKASRQFLFIQNLHGTEPLWVNFGSAANAGAGSIRVAGNESLQMNGFCPSESVNVLGGVLGQAYTAKQA